MITVVVYIVLLDAADATARRVHVPRLHARGDRAGSRASCYRLFGVNPGAEQSWRRYASSRACGSASCRMVLLYVVFRLQNHLPLNPDELAGVDQYVSFNTASSFMTNTNWQAYGGETTMSYLSQMLALTFQNFVSAAVGMAVLVALIRGFARAKRDEVGNFWRDLVRGVVYILLPLAVDRRDRAGDPGGRADARRERVGDGHPGVRAGARPRAGRRPDRDQAARHERRRVLQRELGTSVRGRDPARELHRDVLRSC